VSGSQPRHPCNRGRACRRTVDWRRHLPPPGQADQPVMSRRRAWTLAAAGTTWTPTLKRSGATTRVGGSGAAPRPAATGRCRHVITLVPLQNSMQGPW